MACNNCRNRSNFLGIADSSIPNIADVVYDNQIDNFITETVETKKCCKNKRNKNQGCGCRRDCKAIGEFTTRDLRLCVNPNGSAAYYDVNCRNEFWPTFSSPRRLGCNCLYNDSHRNCNTCNR